MMHFILACIKIPFLPNSHWKLRKVKEAIRELAQKWTMSNQGGRRVLLQQLMLANIFKVAPHSRSYPCGNFSDTSSWTFLRPKGSIGHAFAVCIRTENQNQASFSPFGPHEISVLIELTLGHLRYHLTDVPPQPNSPPDYVFRTDQPSRRWP